MILERSLRPLLISLMVLAFLAISWGFVMFSSETPELKLQGRWKETEWVYEKVERKGQAGNSLSEDVKREITEGMVIHAAESWKFYTDGSAILTSVSGEATLLKWHLKGRGHVLVLTHEDGRAEKFHIQKLKGNLMELHFESDLQLKGIVKIVLNKTD